MKSTIVALLKQDGTIEYIDFEYHAEIHLFSIERIIKNKGETLEVVEEGLLSINKEYVIVGYKNGDKFNKHEINGYITLQDEKYINTTERDIKRYFSYVDLSSEDEELGLNTYDFNDGWLINDIEL